MPTVSGVITAVQEERFRLLTDAGNTFLFTLSRHAPLSGQDLCRLHAANSRVAVRYAGIPDLASGQADDVTVLDAHVEP